MKRFSFLLVMTACFCLPVFKAAAQNPNAKAVKNSHAAAPYKIAYNNLRFGNDAYSQSVLQAWKDFDNNTLENSANLFADDIVATFSDGMMIKGKENFLKAGTEYRGGLAAVSSKIDACTTLKSPDHPEHEVTVIWGVETDTMKDGTTKTSAIHEVWFFNKAGKVTEFHQFVAALPQQNQ